MLATATTDQTRPLARERLALLIVLTAAFAARLPGLLEPLWYDEIWSTRVKVGSLGALVRTVIVDIHPPAYNTMMYGWIAIFGDSELSVRIVPLLAGLGTIALLPALGGVLATRRAGWIAAVLLILSPVHIWYSQEARHYSVLMLCAVLLPLLYFSLEHARARRMRQIGFVALACLLPLIHYYGILLVLAVACIAQLRRRNRAVALLALGVASVALGLLLLVKFRLNALTVSAPYLSAFTADRFAELGAWFLFGGSITFTGAEPDALGARVVAAILAAAALVAIGLWVVRSLQAERGRQALELGALTLAIPIGLLALTVAGLQQSYVNRAALPSLPFFMLVIGAGIDSLRRPALRVAGYACLASGMLVVFTHYSRKTDQWTVYKPNPDWRGAAVELRRELASDSAPIIVLGGAPMSELQYYLTDVIECPWPPRSLATAPNKTGYSARLARAFPAPPEPTCGAGGARRVRVYELLEPRLETVRDILKYESRARPTVALIRYWPGRTRDLVGQLLASGYELAANRPVKGIDLLLFGRLPIAK